MKLPCYTSQDIRNCNSNSLHACIMWVMMSCLVEEWNSTCVCVHNVLVYSILTLQLILIRFLLAYFPYFEKVKVLAYFSNFEKMKVGLWDHIAVCVCARACVFLCIPPIVARQRLGKSPLIVARQRLGKNPLSLLGNGSVRIPLPLLGNGSVKIPL
jgi:hypothetical protein